MTGQITLVELPTFPKGTLGLSLPYLAGVLSTGFHVSILDLNMDEESLLFKTVREFPHSMVGMKVSSQNHHLAEHLTEKLKKCFPSLPVVWGGEFPTLLPETAANHADTIVRGLFDSVAVEFMSDLAKGELRKEYIGTNDVILSAGNPPLWQAVRGLQRYNAFMGLPLETTRGCTESCTFCMVHVMQRKHYHLRSADAIAADIRNIGDRFINIIDYNFGVGPDHVVQVSKQIEESEALGFMAEMCLEMLDDDRVLAALARGRCKMVYCGLESLEQDSLKTIGKHRTNVVEHYRRIISKAQKAGVQVASGFILGMDGSTWEATKRALAFFKEVGIIYVKLTFLTYNPGTRVHEYHAKRGTYLLKGHKYFDGNHLTYLPPGVDAKEVLDSSGWFIRKFYSFRAIMGRALVAKLPLSDKLTFVLFNLCYRQPYIQWGRNGVEDFPFVPLTETYRKTPLMSLSERLLILVWRIQKRMR
jgi:radical SAM superfamily enzyme YgiQ (UPF0313 family)